MHLRNQVFGDAAKGCPPLGVVSPGDSTDSLFGGVAWQHPRFLASIRRGVAASVTFYTGTDLLPSDSVDGTVATIREVELLVEAGLSPLQALSAATHNSAKLCGVLHETGTLAPGKQADLLVVDGKPDQQIRDLRSIRMVMKGGAIFRNELPNLVASGLATPGVALAGGTFARIY